MSSKIAAADACTSRLAETTRTSSVMGSIQPECACLADQLTSQPAR
ncbi:Uncharacterised protein [Mycobacteroides abscessus subsp. abscessus]|nr:Uncharacterised protein [Mycobacteroides abscessus subsp. abscessus]